MCVCLCFELSICFCLCVFFLLFLEFQGLFGVICCFFYECVCVCVCVCMYVCMYACVYVCIYYGKSSMGLKLVIPQKNCI